MTEYVILVSSNEITGQQAVGLWIATEKMRAPSAKAAIRAYLSGTDSQGGEFVAVPARSWQPVKVQVETALRFS